MTLTIIRKERKVGFLKKAGRCVNLPHTLFDASDPASEIAKNGPPRLRKHAWFLNKESVSLSGIVNSAKPIQSAPTTPVKGLDETGDADVEKIKSETDRDRCQTVMTSTEALEADQLGTGTFWDDFISPKRSTSEGQTRKGNWEQWITSCHFAESWEYVDHYT